MDYPLFGRRVEQIKNCSVLAYCGFLESMLCHNRHGFVNSCSIECCTGNLCNKKTLQLAQSTVTPVTRVTYSSSITRANFTRVLTSHVTLTRAPKLTSSIDVSPSSISRNTERTKSNMRTSWTSVKSQFVLFSSVLPTTKPVTVEVQLVCASANRFFIQLSVLLLMAFLGLGFNICGRLWLPQERSEEPQLSIIA